MRLAAIFVFASVCLSSAQQKGRPAEAQPGKASVESAKTAVPLTPEQQARFNMGKGLYVVTCSACHQPHGNGQEALAPPLAGSEWVLGPVSRIARIALQGARGPMTIKGKPFELEMPPLNILDDDQIASVLTYIRREWGNNAAPVEPETVANIRAETKDRFEPWTEAELLKIP